jgi:hypothetical protein
MRVWVLAGVLGMLAAGCGKRCDFSGNQCEGNTLQHCDPLLGGTPVEHPCVAPAELCQETSATDALCIKSPATACDPATFVAYCDTTRRVYCQDGWVTSDDCALAAGSGQCAIQSNVVICH